MKTDRMVAIIMTLLEKERVSAKELAEQFEVSVRTIYRDIDAINMAGVPITALSGPGGGISIMENYKLDKGIFSNTDIINLLMALQGIKNNLPHSNMANTLGKIQSMVPQEMQKEVETKAGQIKIDISPWIDFGEIQQEIQVIQNALEKQRTLEFSYRDIRNNKSIREAEPCRLLFKGGEWYLQAYCLSRQDFRTFKLLRMENLTITDKTYEYKPYPQKKTDENSFTDREFISVKLKIHENIKDRIISRFGRNCITGISGEIDDFYEAQILMPKDRLAYEYLLSFGTNCQCLSPDSVRKELKKLSGEIYDLYAD